MLATILRLRLAPSTACAADMFGLVAIPRDMLSCVSDGEGRWFMELITKGRSTVTRLVGVGDGERTGGNEEVLARFTKAGEAGRLSNASSSAFLATMAMIFCTGTLRVPSGI